MGLFANWDPLGMAHKEMGSQNGSRNGVQNGVPNGVLEKVVFWTFQGHEFQVSEYLTRTTSPARNRWISLEEW